MAQWRPAGAPPARFAVALAAAAVPVATAPFLEHPERAAETAYLGLLAALLLMTLAALPAPGRRPDALAPAAVLAVLALVALPLGPVRGVTLSALLVLAVALALAPHLAAPARHWHRETAVLLPAAVAVQVLYRADGLLAPAADLHTLVVYGVMPLTAAAAAAFLAVRHGRAPVLVAAAGAVVLCGGIHVVSALSLVALAAGELLARPPSGLPAGSALAWRAAAVLALMAPFAWQQRTAGLALLTGLATAALVAAGDGGRAAWRPVVHAAVLAAAVGAALALPLRPWTDAAPALALGLLLLPLLPWRLIRDARRAPRRPAAALGGIALALAAVRCAPDVSALALPLALLSLYVALPEAPGEGTSRVHHGVALQGVWSAALILVAALLATYPWLRPQPAASTLELLRLDATGWSGLAVVTVATAAALWPRPAPPRHAALPVLAGLLLFHAALAVPPPRLLLGPPGVELRRATPSVERELEPPAAGRRISILVVHSHLSYATPLPTGTPVFDLLLFADGEQPVARWTLRAGVETGEWAARRVDAAAALAHRPPAPHVVWVAPGGGFFGQSYRARHQLPRGVEARRLVVRRRAGLPPAVTVHLERLEAAP